MAIEMCHYCGTDVDTDTIPGDHYHVDGEPVCDDCAEECGYVAPPSNRCEACDGDSRTGDGEFCVDCISDMASKRHTIRKVA